MCLSVSVQKDWNLHQIDLPTTFLNGVMNTEVFIKAPEGLKTESKFVDDGLITGPEDQVQELLRDLRNEFNIKEMTEVKTFLGMEISKNGKGLKITQTRMITRLLEEFSMIETRKVATPMEVNFQVKEEEPIINNFHTED
ncbi:hypothetical protein JTB14_033080 [Gonioctena quinquepunctata]|nr:hypothetical protein JTB14_033080 [Gonioctena quinquepunctata]